MKKTLLLLATLLLGYNNYGQVTIGSGTNVDSNVGFSTPISVYYSTSLSQTIYLASEINATGTITALEFQLNSTSAIPNSNGMIDVWIGHTSNIQYNPVISTTGADWIGIASHTQVLTNGSFTQSGNLVTFTLDTPFEYNGTDNLVITVDANKPGDDGSSIVFYQTAASSNIMSLMIRTDYAIENADPHNPPLNFTGSYQTESVQGKNTRPIITLQGLTTMGIEDKNITHSNISLYPNPATNEVMIKSGTDIINAELYSITGRLMKKYSKLEDNKLTISDLETGVYMVKLNMEDGSSSIKKLIKK